MILASSDLEFDYCVVSADGKQKLKFKTFAYEKSTYRGIGRNHSGRRSGRLLDNVQRKCIGTNEKPYYLDFLFVSSSVGCFLSTEECGNE